MENKRIVTHVLLFLVIIFDLSQSYIWTLENMPLIVSIWGIVDCIFSLFFVMLHMATISNLKFKLLSIQYPTARWIIQIGELKTQHCKSKHEKNREKRAKKQPRNENKIDLRIWRNNKEFQDKKSFTMQNTHHMRLQIYITEEFTSMEYIPRFPEFFESKRNGFCKPICSPVLRNVLWTQITVVLDGFEQVSTNVTHSISKHFRSNIDSLFAKVI